MQQQFQATPGKQGKGFKYAIIGCGCLLLLVLAVVVLLFLGGGMAWFAVSDAPEPSGMGVPSTGGATCQKAIDCCKKVYAKTGTDQSVCNNYANVPEASCTAALTSLKSSASTLGVSCD